MTTVAAKTVGVATGLALLGGLVWLGVARGRDRRRAALGLVTVPQRAATNAYLSEARRALKVLDAKTAKTETALQDLKSFAKRTRQALDAQHEALLQEDLWNQESIYDGEGDDAELVDDHEDVQELHDFLEEVTAPNEEEIDGALQYLEDDWKSQLDKLRNAIADAEDAA